MIYRHLQTSCRMMKRKTVSHGQLSRFSGLCSSSDHVSYCHNEIFLTHSRLFNRLQNLLEYAGACFKQSKCSVPVLALSGMVWYGMVYQGLTSHLTQYRSFRRRESCALSSSTLLVGRVVLQGIQLVNSTKCWYLLVMISLELCVF